MSFELVWRVGCPPCLQSSLSLLTRVSFKFYIDPFSPFTVVLLPTSAVPKWFVTWYWNCFITHEARALRVCAPKLFAFQIGTRSTAIYVCMHTGAVFWTNFLEVYCIVWIYSPSSHGRIMEYITVIACSRNQRNKRK